MPQTPRRSSLWAFDHHGDVGTAHCSWPDAARRSRADRAVSSSAPRFDDADEDDQRLDLDDLTPEREQALIEAARARVALIGIDSLAR